MASEAHPVHHGGVADHNQESGEGRSPHSVRSVYTTVRPFLRFAVAEGMTDETLLTATKRPKTPQSEKRIYQQGQLQVPGARWA